MVTSANVYNNVNNIKDKLFSNMQVMFFFLEMTAGVRNVIFLFAYQTKSINKTM